MAFPFNDVLAALVELSSLRSEHASELDADVQDAIQSRIANHQQLLRQEFGSNPVLAKAVDRFLNALDRNRVQAGKEHHFVPQLYLRHFRSDAGGAPRSQPDFGVTKSLAAKQAFHEGQESRKRLCEMLLAGANPI